MKTCGFCLPGLASVAVFDSLSSPSSLSLPHPQQQRSSHSSLKVFNPRDAGFMEVSVGGECYKMVPLPDSMVDTTLFVGNLNEFIHDDDLSHFFCAVLRSQSLSACVVRKANMMSLEYGFVSFTTVEDKEVSYSVYSNGFSRSN
jgi:hypothetical protein